MRQGEFKKKYDPVTGKYTRKHVYGEGISDKVRSFGSKVSGKKLLKNKLISHHLLLKNQVKRLVMK